MNEPLNFILLTQFSHPYKCWIMGIHFEGQLNVWEINLNCTTQASEEQLKHIEFCQMPSVSLTHIWWSNTRVYNDLQPFSIAELRSKPY